MNRLAYPGELSMGRFEPADTGIHHLVPAVKLISVILLTSTVLFSPLFPQLPLLFLFFCLICWNAGLKVRRLMTGVRPVLPFLAVIVVIQVFFISREVAGDPLAAWGFFRIYREDLLFTAQLFGRFFALVLLFSLFSAVTPVTEISHGTEALFSLFGKNALAHDFSLVATITFRFIPILAREAEQITKAQASRGGSFGTWKMGLIKKIRLYIPLIVPLFVAALERSEILVEAMESRCYEPGQIRTRLDEFKWRTRDRAGTLLVAGIFILVLVSRLYQQEILAELREFSIRLMSFAGWV